MDRRSSFILGLALVAMAFAPLRATAQERGRNPVSHQHLISGTPLMLLAGWFEAEYETKLAGATTVGATGGWLEWDEVDYTQLDAFLRFYPQGAAFTGFYLGGRFGLNNVDDDGDSETAFGIGVDVGYAWLLGPGRSFHVALGVGATQLLGLGLDDAPETIPSFRAISVGIAF